MNLTGKIERVKVELKVQKSLMGYRHGGPSDYYIAVVGSGRLLGDNNPNLAPRCTRIGNNIWTKDIWLQKESLVTFKCLIVHAATNSAVEIENVPARHVHIGQGPAVIEARFNKAGLIGAYGIKEIRESEEVDVERKLITEKNLQKPSEKSRKDEETAQCQEKSIAGKIISDKGRSSTGVPDNIKSIIDKIPEALKDKYMEEIDKHTVIHEQADSGNAGVKKMVIGIPRSTLKRLNITMEDVAQAFEKMGLPLSTPTNPYLPEGYSHHEIWLSNRNTEKDNAVKDMESGNDTPALGLEEQQKNEKNLLSHEEQINKLDLSPARHERQKRDDKTRIDENIGMPETLISTEPKWKSRSANSGWLSRKRNIVAALGGVALVSCLGLYAFYKK